MSLVQQPFKDDIQRSSGLRVSTTKLGNLALGLVVFLSGFVFFEPAPYELAVIPVLAVWFASGLTLRRSFLPLIFLLFCFICGGAISATQRADIANSFFYIIVTGFLATTSIFFAAIVAQRPQERLRIIFNAYIIAAIVGASIGILAYFGLFPNADTFTFGGRARGPFQDPNVFAPFLVLPAVFLLRRVLVTPLAQSLWSFLGLVILVMAIFLAFSRAAWGLALLAFTSMILIIYVTSATQSLRNKVSAMSVFMGFGFVGLLLIALSFDAVATLFDERARLVQSYDSAQFGRFARYSYALEWIMQGPLGYGFGKSRETFGEDTHNVYIKAFLVYGWLGGIAYLTLVATTLGVGFKHLFKDRPWQAYFQTAYIVIFGHAFVGLVVDIDRWRHLYLIYGIVWGMIAAETALTKGPVRTFKSGSRA